MQHILLGYSFNNWPSVFVRLCYKTFSEFPVWEYFGMKLRGRGTSECKCSLEQLTGSFCLHWATVTWSEFPKRCFRSHCESSFAPSSYKDPKFVQRPQVCTKNLLPSLSNGTLRSLDSPIEEWSNRVSDFRKCWGSKIFWCFLDYKATTLSPVATKYRATRCKLFHLSRRGLYVKCRPHSRPQKRKLLKFCSDV